MLRNRLTSESDSGSSTDTHETTQDYGTIDLGKGGPGGGQKFEVSEDPKEGYAAAVETSETITDAGGPGAALAGTSEQVQEINTTVSEVSGQITDAQETQTDTPDETTTEIPQAQTAAANAAAASGPGGPNGPDDLLGAVLSALSSFVAALVPGGQ
jgi:hypothetical protein